MPSEPQVWRDVEAEPQSLWTPPLDFPIGREHVAPFFAGDRRAIVLGVLRAADVAVIGAAGFSSYVLRHAEFDPPALYWWQILATCAVMAATLHWAQVYTFHSLRLRNRHLGWIALACAASALVMIAALFFVKLADEVSRIWVLLSTLLCLAGLVGVRLTYWVWLAHSPQASKLISNVAIVGPQGAAEKLAEQLEDENAGDVRVLGIFHTPSDGSEGELEILAQLARSVRVDEILMALPFAGAEDIRQALQTVGTLPADVKLCLDFESAAPGSAGLLSAQPLLISRRPLAGWRIIVKRGMDVALSAALLLLLAPLMVALAALVKLDTPGPAIFRQRRFGFNKQPFTVYKFRTMYAAPADPAVQQATRSDPRVTRLGRFLRRSSLDELPQLFNVFGGSMSLVGPRPHAIVHDEKYAATIDNYLSRHRVLPGITGWAQVNGFRGETETTEKMASRVEHDLFYIDHWSPLLDLRILVRTLRVAVGDRNAY